MSETLYDDEKPSKDSKAPSEHLTIQNILRTESGRGFMYGHLQSCLIFENIFDQDPVKHAYNAGVRKAGLLLEQKLKDADPAGYLKMIGENM